MKNENTVDRRSIQNIKLIKISNREIKFDLIGDEKTGPKWMHGVAYFLSSLFIWSLTLLVDTSKVWHDDRYRKRYDEHTAQWTDAADELADYRVRNHISVTTQRQHTNRHASRVPQNVSNTYNDE